MLLLKKIVRNPVQEESYTAVTTNFIGPVSTAEIVIRDTISSIKKRLVSYNINISSESGKLNENAFVALDFATSKNGLIDKNGEWIRQPKYEGKLRRLNKFFFRTQLPNGYDNYYNYDNLSWLNPTTELLEKMNHYGLEVHSFGLATQSRPVVISQ